MTLSKSLLSINFVVLALISLALTPTYMYAQSSDNSTFILLGNSMHPNIRQNDGVIVDSHIPFNSLKVDDIIVFRTFGTIDSGQHIVIIHRVARIVTDSQGHKILRTKGDANPDSIPAPDYPIFEQNYIGKVVNVVPQLGIISADNFSAANSGVGNNATDNG
ncbi:MAG: signal peptidase I [Candidatus Nitrosopolaris sp.]